MIHFETDVLGILFHPMSNNPAETLKGSCGNWTRGNKMTGTGNKKKL
jgi:hypothetical protein